MTLDESGSDSGHLTDELHALGRRVLEFDPNEVSAATATLTNAEMLFALGCLYLALLEARTQPAIARTRLQALAKALASRIIDDASHSTDIAQALTGYSGAVVIAVGDQLIESGRLEDAATAYSLGLESADSRGEQVELGYLYSHRARVAPEPLLSAPVLEEAYSTLYTPGLSLGSGPDARACQQIVNLALKAYGRAFVGFVESAAEPDTETCEDEDFHEVFANLDGLDVIFSEFKDWRAVEAVCRAYDEWPCGEVDERIDDRFVATRFWLAGRHAGRPIGSANERLDVRKELEVRFEWFPLLYQLGRNLPEYLINAQIYDSRVDTRGDSAPTVLELYKALEGTLKVTIGGAVDREEIPGLTAVYRQLGKGTRLSKANLPTYRTFLQTIQSNQMTRLLFADWLKPTLEGSQDWLDQLTRTVERLVEGDNARHSKEAWKVSREITEQLKRQILGDAEFGGLIPGLVRVAWKARSGERG